MSARSRKFGLALAFLGCFGAASAEGKLYRWTDGQGNVHYSDQPVSNAQEVQNRSQPATNAGAVTPPSTPAAASAARQGGAAPSPADCQTKKDQLTSYKSAAKITETNGLGETHEYSDEQRQKLLDVTEKAVHDACGAS